jgi:nucleotide-binding universal stress UspA family protein
VRGGNDHGSPRIVVGVDGSPSSKAALVWALRQAERTGAVVEAVTAWWYPSGYGMAPTLDGTVDFEGDAGKTLAETLAEVSGVAPDVRVGPRVAYGHPAWVLLEAARGADLLVVGSRGHGGFAAALLGSVSRHCVQHAPWPVLVVRGYDQVSALGLTRPKAETRLSTGGRPPRR